MREGLCRCGAGPGAHVRPGSAMHSAPRRSQRVVVVGWVKRSATHRVDTRGHRVDTRPTTRWVALGDALHPPYSYNAGMNDTHPDAERVQIELLRKAGPEHRMAMACSLTDYVVQLAKQAIARAHPQASQREHDLLFIEVHYGRHVANLVRRQRGAAA